MCGIVAAQVALATHPQDTLILSAIHSASNFLTFSLTLANHLGMYARVAVPRELRDLARQQSNVVTMAQVESFGLTRNIVLRMRETDVFTSLARGLYALGPTSWASWAWGGVLLSGTSAVIGGRAAAHLHGLGNEPRVIDIWSPSRRLNRGPWRFHLGLRDACGAPPRLSFEDTLLETASWARNQGELVSTLARGLAIRGTTPQRLAEAAELSRLDNKKQILKILDDLKEGIESNLEHLYLIHVERRHRLPVGKRQVSLSDGTRSDVYYEAFGVVVELDGRLGHEGEGRFRDWRRDNVHAMDGIITLRFGWWDVRHHACDVAAAVARALRARGWTGALEACTLCPQAV